MAKEKSSRGNASQFFVAGQLCRRGLAAVVTLGNCPNTDILCSNTSGTRFVHIQVKTFKPGNKTCSASVKAEKYYGDNFFWILSGIPYTDQNLPFEYYIIPSKIMSKEIKAGHKKWLETPGKNNKPHKDTNMRNILLPPLKSPDGWDISCYRNRWDLIEEKLKD